MTSLAQTFVGLLGRRLDAAADPCAARELPANEAFSVRPPREGTEVSVLDGLVLVTQAGDPDDHVLGPGDVASFRGRGRVAALALRASRVRVCAPRRRGPAR